MTNERILSLFIALSLAAAGTGCSVRKFAINKLGDAIASGGTTYQSDEDVELVTGALPFGLKLIESLLAESPKHKGLMQAACQGFASYAYVEVQQKADRTAGNDLEAAAVLRERARRLYLRAYAYGTGGLEVDYPGIREQLLSQPKSAALLLKLKKKDVPLLYWSAAALGLAISSSRDDVTLLARLPEVEALLDRALRLDESWQDGSLHEFRVIFEGARPGGANLARIKKSFERALELSGGRNAGLYVSYAEAVSIPKQNREEFELLLKKALAIDPNVHKDVRLLNLVAQRRARWLLQRIDDLILADNNPEVQP